MSAAATDAKPRTLAIILESHMKITFKVLIYLIAHFSFSQNTISTFEQDLYEKATARIDAIDNLNIRDGLKSENPEVVKFATNIEQKAIKEALELFQKIFDTIPNTKLQNKIDYDLARLYSRSGNSKLAIEFFKKTIENEQSITLSSEDEENYTRKNICIWLAKMLIEINDYKAAKIYIEKSKEYKVKYFCGNSYVEDSNQITKLLEICETELKKGK